MYQVISLFLGLLANLSVRLVSALTGNGAVKLANSNGNKQHIKLEFYLNCELCLQSNIVIIENVFFGGSLVYKGHYYYHEV